MSTSTPPGRKGRQVRPAAQAAAAPEPGLAREALRQQLLMAALWAKPVAVPADAAAPEAAALSGWLREQGVRQARGLQAHTAHAAVLAPQVLAQAYPTAAALVGDEAWRLIARRHWHAHPPWQGDLACWGEHLPQALAADAQLLDLPYLADVARLDWAVHISGRAADGPEAVQDLARLAELDPSQASLRLAPGAALVVSPWPVASIWAAHSAPAVDLAQTGGAPHAAGAAPDGLAQAGAALARGQAETAWVWRPLGQWRTRVQALSAGDAALQAALLRHQPLAQAMDSAWAAEPAWTFEAWLVQALQAGWLAGVLGPADDQARGAG